MDGTNQGIPTGFFFYTFSMESLAPCRKPSPYSAPKKTARDSQGNRETGY